MSLTVYSGTFNPIHTAHLIVAETVRSDLSLENIVFIPSGIPPHRSGDIAAAAHRFEMVSLAIKDNSCFSVSDIEITLSEKSYSYTTISRLYELNPHLQLKNEKINFIIGADAFLLIDSWYKAQEFAEKVNFIILARPDSPSVEEIVKMVKIKNFTYKEVRIPQMEISSSYIRDRIEKGLSVKYLVPADVEAYIINNSLYK